MVDIGSYGALGTTIETGELTDGAVTNAKLDDTVKPQWVKYAEVDNTSTADSEFDFDSLADHKHWKVVFYVIPSTNGDAVYLQLNGDTTNKYAYLAVLNSGLSFSSAQSSILLGYSDLGGSGEVYACSGELEVFNEQGTTNSDQTLVKINTAFRADAGIGTIAMGYWTSNATLTRIRLFMANNHVGKAILYYDQNLD